MSNGRRGTGKGGPADEGCRQRQALVPGKPLAGTEHRHSIRDCLLQAETSGNAHCCLFKRYEKETPAWELAQWSKNLLPKSDGLCSDP